MTLDNLTQENRMKVSENQSSTPSISVIIPVYNSEESLTELHRRLNLVLQNIAYNYEIIFVDDGSIDGSWNVIHNLSESFSSTRGLQHSRNYGQHNALLCGIREARHEIIITLDDDLQNPPEEIPILIQKLEEGYDVVYGTPKNEQHGIFRDMSSCFIKLALQKSMGIDTARYVSAFRAFRTNLRDSFANYHSPYVVIDVLLSWATTSFSHVSVDHEKRKHGKSNYNLSKLMNHAVNMIAGFSVFPLQIASYLGFSFTIFGIGILIYVVARYFWEDGGVPGFPFLASVIVIFAGVQLFVLGIIGEYLARIHMRNMGRPYSTIRKRIGFDNPLK
jgi:glycosyltransferase involved in cell wall biosynthesis